MKPIPNFPDYSISEDGEIYSFKKQSKGKQLNTGVDKSSGFYKVNLCKDGKMNIRYVHRLVAECYIPNPDNLKTVRHKNGDKLDNRKDNLEWRECNKKLPEYKVWENMKYRCNSNSKRVTATYKREEIIVCERWNKFENFYQDMGKRPGDNYQLDRIDNDRGYSPDNCQWITQIENLKKRAPRYTYTPKM